MSEELDLFKLFVVLAPLGCALVLVKEIIVLSF